MRISIQSDESWLVRFERRSAAAPANRNTVGSGAALCDPLTIVDRATYDEPSRYAEGVDSVVVSGQIVLRRGQMTGALPGRALAR